MEKKGYKIRKKARISSWVKRVNATTTKKAHYCSVMMFWGQTPSRQSHVKPWPQKAWSWLCSGSRSRGLLALSHDQTPRCRRSASRRRLSAPDSQRRFHCLRPPRNADKARQPDSPELAGAQRLERRFIETHVKWTRGWLRAWYPLLWSSLDLGMRGEAGGFVTARAAELLSSRLRWNAFGVEVLIFRKLEVEPW